MDQDGQVFDTFFTGTYSHTLDTKGRVSLPAKFRKSLPVNLKLVPFGKAVYLFSLPNYHEWAYSFFGGQKPNVRSKADMNTWFSLTAHAEDTEVDSAGRISISAEMRSRVGLDKDVKIVGLGDHIEIMSPQEYEARDADTSSVLWLDD